MEESIKPNKPKINPKIFIVIFAILGLVLTILVGVLIVRVTAEQNKEEIVYSDSATKDSGNGLGTEGGSSNSTGTDVALQGFPTMGGSSASASSNSTNTMGGNSGGSSSNSSAQAQQQQQPVKTQTLPNGLKIEEFNSGSGAATSKSGNTLVVHYVGYLPDGKVFDTSLKGEKKPFGFKLGAGQVIKGWDIGLQEMKVGALRRLTIPASLAYGASGSPPTIPPNTPLVFDVQLMAIQ